jgi:hypothetical protein
MPNPMSNAPTDGRTVTIQWRDRDGVENVSQGSYRESSDPAQRGWWVFTDGDTQKRVDPHGWVGANEEEGDEDA